MRNGHDGATLQQIHRVFNAGTFTGVADGPLLERFVAQRDEAALEALIARHGPLILSVCRRFLRDPNDVEDAFQATLLVLVRQAKTVRVRDSLGPWLYGVAYRVAIRARARAQRREVREPSDLESEIESPATDQDGHELQPILHEELSRLPEKFRAPIVLCYLEGLTHDLAAAQLQWPVGTVRSRLARARDLLRTRLTRRGLSCSAGLITAALAARPVSAALPRMLATSTMKTATRVAAGGAIAEVVSASVVALMEGVLSPCLRQS